MKTALRRGRPALLLLAIVLSYGCGGPEVVAVVPADGAVVDYRETTVEVRFNTPVEVWSARDAFSLSEDGGGKVNGKVVVEGVRLIFTADDELKGGRVYRLGVSTQLMDEDGRRMQTPFFSNFRTGTNAAPAETTFLSPTNQESGVALTNLVRVAFSRPMNAVSVRDNLSFSPQMDGLIEWNAETNLLVFRPIGRLSPATAYTFTIAAEAKDREGVPLGRAARMRFFTGEDYTWPETLGMFQIGDLNPVIAGRYWETGRTNVLREEALVVDFNLPMDRIATENAVAILPQTAGFFSWRIEPDADGTPHHQLVFTPHAPFDPGIDYEFTVSTSAKGENNLAVLSQFRRVFRVDDGYFVRLTNITDISNVTLSRTAVTTIDVAAGGFHGFDLYFATRGGVAMDVGRVQDNISIRRLFGEGDTSAGGRITGFDWSGGLRLRLEVAGLGVSNTYLLSVKGGKDRVRDVAGNWMSENAEVMFRVR